MKKTKFISVLMALFMSVISFSQSTTESFAHTLPFGNNDLLQEFNAIGFLSPSTFSGSPSTISYSSTLPFGNNDNLQVYNAIRMLGASPAFTSTGWGVAGNSIASGDFLGTTNSEALVFKTNNATRLSISPAGIFTISATTATTNVNGTFYYDPTLEGFYWYHSDASGSSNNFMIANSQRALGFFMPATTATATPYGVQFSTSDVTGLGFSPNGTFAMGVNTTSACITKNTRVGSTTAPTCALDVTGAIKASLTSSLTGINNTGALTTSTTFSCGTNFTCTGTSLHTGASTFVAALTGSNSIQSTSKTGGIGYAVGSGSTVTQVTSRTTGVTINAVTGSITLFNTAGSASYQSFTVTNSAVGINDVISINQRNGTDLYVIEITAVAAGSFRVTFATTGGTTSEAPVFNFAVIKGQTN